MSKKSGKNKCRKKSCLPAAGLIGAVTALAGATAYGVTKMLVNTALDRDPPKLMQKSNNLISGSPADPEFDAFVAQKGKELREMPHEDVEITAADGIKLKGHWYHKEGRQAGHFGHARLAFLMDKGFRSHCRFLFCKRLQRAFCRAAGSE